MSEFDQVLQACLDAIEQGALDVQGCLQRYPQFAPQLEPILLTSLYLARGREAQLSPAFRSRVRARLVHQMHAHPRRTAQPAWMFMRLAGSLAAVLLALLAGGTAYAQRALPGEAFYAWKLASENTWRAVSPDPVETDLALAERRLDELAAVAQDPALQEQTLAAYLQLAERLRAQVTPADAARVLAALDAQAEDLARLGIVPGEATPEPVLPTAFPSATSTPTPLPAQETPQVQSTVLPEIVPTGEVLPTLPDPPVVLPTIADPPKILPTVEIPPPIP